MGLFAMGFFDQLIFVVFMVFMAPILGIMVLGVIFAQATKDKPETRSKVQDVATGLAAKGAVNGAGWVFKKLFKL